MSGPVPRMPSHRGCVPTAGDVRKHTYCSSLRSRRENGRECGSTDLLPWAGKSCRRSPRDLRRRPAGFLRAVEAMPSRVHRRRASLLVPLFSMPSASSWGVGEIADLPMMAAWLRECGLHMLQLLPLNEMATGQNSPYCAMSALAFDPIYISIARIPEFRALGGVNHLAPGARDRLAAVRDARTV